MSTPAYRPRHPERSPFYQCLEDYWDEFKQSYPCFYEADYGSWRSEGQTLVGRLLECGILRHAFARIHCPQLSSRSAAELASPRDDPHPGRPSRFGSVDGYPHLTGPGNLRTRT